MLYLLNMACTGSMVKERIIDINTETAEQKTNITVNRIDGDSRINDMTTKKEIEYQVILIERYEKIDPTKLTVPRRPVTRKDYVDFVRPWAEDYEMTPEADQWGWRHGPLRILPPITSRSHYLRHSDRPGGVLRSGRR